MRGEDNVRRQHRSDIYLLLQEARAIELLANEAEIDPAQIQEYWSLSADLIALVADVEQYEQQFPNASYDDPALFAFKHRLRAVASRLTQMVSDQA
jgi:hypothetical protein